MTEKRELPELKDIAITFLGNCMTVPEGKAVTLTGTINALNAHVRAQAAEGEAGEE